MKKIFTIIALLLGFQSIAQPSDAYLLSRMNAGRQPGASFVIIKDGKWVYQRSLGKADVAGNEDVELNTVFMMASVSKTMIVTAMMQLWEKGLINLDTNVNDYLPFPVQVPGHASAVITPRMLLTHTAAIEDNWSIMIPLYVPGDSPVPLDSFMKNYFVPGGNWYDAAENFYAYTPGTQYNYSNIGSTLAAYLVERITGDPFHHYCDTAIFQKLCMDNTSFLLSGIQDTDLIARPHVWDAGSYVDVGLYGYPDYPDGQLRTNITALARFMTMYMQRGIYEGTRVLDSSTVDTILSSQTTALAGQGLIFYAGTSSNGDMLWGHNGGDAGVNTAMYFNMQNQTGAIVMTNGDGTGLANADILADTLYKYGITITPSATDTFPACNTATAIASIAGGGDVQVYPNPTAGNIGVRIPVDGAMTVWNMQGQIADRYALKTGVNNIALSSALPAGIYIARIADKDGRQLTARRVVLTR